MDLADVPNDAMLREMQRRLDCMTRPEKRIILVGARLGACGSKALVEQLSLASFAPCCH